MNTRLAFEDYTALHHRLETLRAIDETPEKSEKPQLAFETRPAQEMIKEEVPQLSLGNGARHETPREPEEKAPAMWRSILQLRVLLPYVSKLLPMLESGLGNHNTPAPAHNSAIQAVERTANDMQNSHRELRIQLQDQAIEFKQVEEKLERLREATERNTLEQQELIEDLKSVAGTIKLVGWSVVTLLTAVLGGVCYVALHLGR